MAVSRALLPPSGPQASASLGMASSSVLGEPVNYLSPLLPGKGVAHTWGPVKDGHAHRYAVPRNTACSSAWRRLPNSVLRACTAALAAATSGTVATAAT